MFCANCGKENKVEVNFCPACGRKNLDKADGATPLTIEEHIKPVVNSTISQSEYESRNKRNRKIGLWLLISPGVILVSTLFLFTITNYVITQINYTELDTTNTSSTLIIASIIRVILGLVGVLGVVGLFIGIPLGIIYLNKKENDPNKSFDPRSGKGSLSTIPPEIQKWNWGAIGLSWIWGAAHGVWIAFLTFIPLVNIVVLIYLGLKGNELAWQAKQWESVEKFIEAQRRWRAWGIFFFVLGIIGFLGKILGSN